MTESNGEGLADEMVLQSVRDWLSWPGVVGLSIEGKTVGGEPTGQRALVVHVVEKVAREQLGEDDVTVPASIDVHVQGPDGEPRTVSMPTDVLEVGEPRLQALDQRVRPCPGGYQVTAAGTEIAGTLGVSMLWRGAYRLLSSNHVISENGNVGTEVYEPISTSDDIVGQLGGFVPVVTYPSDSEPNPVENKQDLAWADVGRDLCSPLIHQIGSPKGLRSPQIGERVRLIGKETGTVQSARVLSTTLKMQLRWPIGGVQWAWFGSLIKLDGVVTVAGDSGAAYVGDDDMVVGLHMGATDTYSWGCIVTE